MSRFVIQIPVVDIEKTVEVIVKVNGARQRTRYKVELFDWPEGATHEARIDRLREIIAAFDPAWELFQIGPDNDEGKIPIVFRQRAAPASPDALTRDVAAN